MSYYEVGEELKNILLADWQFKALDFSETGDVPDIAIEEQFMLNSELEFDCINVVSELYFVQTLNTLNISKKINHENFNELKRISSYHHKLLFLKKFFILELKECLNDLEIKNNEILTLPYRGLRRRLLRLYDRRFIIPAFLKAFIYEPSDYDKNYRLHLLIILFSLLISNNHITFRKQYLEIRRNGETNRYDTEVINLLTDEAKHIISGFNLNIKHCQEYIIKQVTVKDFEVFNPIFQVEDFYETLKKEMEDKHGEMLSRYAFSKLNCYASMTIHHMNYFTVNGINDKPSVGSNLEHLIDCFKSILKGNGDGSNFEYVSISDDTRYYLSDGISITYKDFKDFEHKPANYNRMFTCCERKLIAKILDLAPKGVNNIEIVTSKPPCALCQRAFNIISSNKEYKYNIYPKYGESWAQLPIEEYDNFANQVKTNKT